MIATNPAFDVMAATGVYLPIYRFTIQGYNRIFVYEPTGRTNEVPWITDIGDWGISVDDTNGSYTIDALIVSLLDVGGLLTKELSLVQLETRRCSLQIGFAGLDVNSYVTIFNGIVTYIQTDENGVYQFTCNDYNRLGQRVIYLYGDNTTTYTYTTTFDGANYITTTVKEVRNLLASPESYTETTVSTVDLGTTLPNTTPPTTLGNTTTTVVGPNSTTTTVVAITYNGDPTLPGHYIQTTAITVTTNNSGPYNVVTTTTVTASTTGTVGTIVQTDQALISSNNPRRVTAHPLNILISILQDEIGLADSDVKLVQIQTYRDTVFAGIEFDFIITSSVDAKDFIETQLLKPLGGYLYPNSAGQLCVGFCQPLTDSVIPLLDINPDNLHSLPAINPSTLINIITMRFDKDDAGTSNSTTGFLAEANTFYAPSITDLNDLTGQVAAADLGNSSSVQGQLIIESNGMRSGFQGYLLAKMISNSIFAKYGLYNPAMTVQVHWKTAFQLEIGEYVTVTHPLLPDKRAGTIGMVAKIFQIVKRSYNFSTMTVTFDLTDASGLRSFGSHRIAPNGKAGYAGVSSDDQKRYLFMGSMGGTQTNGDQAGTLG